METLRFLWSYEFPVIPVFLSVLLFELPSLLRRHTGWYYVPIYFPLFPLNELNKDLSIYLGEDYFYGEGERLSDDDVKSLRNHIIHKSIIAMALSAVIVPLLLGFIVAIYLNEQAFYGFVISLIAYKSVGIFRSILGFHQHAIGKASNLLWLGGIYLCYLGVVFEMLRTSYSWSRPYLAPLDLRGLFDALSAMLFGKVIVGGIIITLLTNLFTARIADPEVRNNNVSKR